LAIVDPQSSVAKEFAALESDLSAKRDALEKASAKTAAWREPLSPDDAQAALQQAHALNSIFRFFQPAFWRLRTVLNARYDFSKHAVAPTWKKILTDLVAHHNAQAAYDDVVNVARQKWQTQEVVANLSEIHAQFAELNQVLKGLLAEHHEFDFPTLSKTLGELQAETNT